jgi:acyl-CoA thioesterase
MNLADMTFTAVTELFTEQQFHIETYRNEINRLTKIVEGYDRDEEILTLRRSITDQDTQLEAWMNVADGLYKGLKQTEEQLAQENIGLRAVARDAIQHYRDMSSRK